MPRRLWVARFLALQVLLALSCLLELECGGGGGGVAASNQQPAAQQDEYKLSLAGLNLRRELAAQRHGAAAASSLCGAQRVMSPSVDFALPACAADKFWNVLLASKGSAVESPHQFEPVFERLEHGEPITVALIGSSVTAGHAGCYNNMSDDAARRIAFRPQPVCEWKRGPVS